MTEFKLHAPYTPMGDQPQAIEKLAAGIEQGHKHQTLLGATGTGKSTSYDCPVFIVKQDGARSTTHVEPIGPLIDSLIEQYVTELRYDRDTVILDSAATRSHYFTQSFNPTTGKVDLYPIQSFTRHATPAAMYHLKTTCGRSVTLTGDHNLWVLRDGSLQLIETAAARPSDRLPLPLTLLGAGELNELELMPRLAGKNMFVDASEMIRSYVAEQGSKAFVQAINAQGISGNDKISHIRHTKRGAGIAIDMLPDVLQRTDNFGGHWDVRQATISSASNHQLPSSLPLTPPLLRLIGYYIAEGNAQKDCVIIANDQPTIRESIEAAVKQLGLTFTVRPSSDYTIWSVALAHVLGTECGKVARTKSLPSFWPQLSNTDLGLLLQAYFDGDGTVDRAKAISATTASQKLASDLCYALLRFGIWGRIGKRWKRATNSDHAGDWSYQVTISGQSDLRRFAEQIGFSLVYKQQALADHLGFTENSNVDLVPLDGAQLRWLRQQLGLFARQLGERFELSRSAIQIIETGGRSPQRSSLLRILEALGDIASARPVADAWWQVWHSIHSLCQLRWAAIESVELVAYDHPHVYDFCVPGAETFLAGNGGLFVHNTFVAAQLVQRLQRPTLVMAHNKTLAAQLYSEFKEFFPENAIGYFVSYYDAFTPEAYVPSKDLYIEKEAQINEEIDRLRHEATQALFTRRDVLIVASVSAIYGLGSPTDYGQVVLSLRVGEMRNRDKVLRTLIDLQFERNDIDFHRGTFRVRGDTLEIFPANAETAFRVEMWGDEIERIVEVDPLTGEILTTKTVVEIFPAKHFVTTSDKMKAAIGDIEQELVGQLAHLEGEGKILEAARLKQRTMYDLEIMQELGYCSGIENYSRHMDRRGEGQTPWTLLDYFPDDFLLFVDESHISMPQIRGMFNGDRSRKQTLVDFGFRLPSALDNRPLMFDEFERHVHQAIYVSATPGPYEYQHSEQVVQQIIRPTGLIDPVVHVRPSRGQIDDLLGEIKRRVDTGSRAIVTTLTKRMAEDLTDYLKEMGVRTEYLHSDVDTLERVDILRDLRLGVFDVVVGINLLREGLDLPEVSLVAILDADKSGFLRSESALIQTIGRAARHIDGTVIMYGDRVTPAMEYAINETKRRRGIQEAYNQLHGIEPRGIVKGIRDINERLRKVADEKAAYNASGQDTSELSKDALFKLIVDAEKEMKQAAKNLEFEKAALLRDQVVELRQTLALMDDVSVIESLNQRPRRAAEAKPAYGDKKKVKGRPRGKM